MTYQNLDTQESHVKVGEVIEFADLGWEKMAAYMDGLEVRDPLGWWEMRRSQAGDCAIGLEEQIDAIKDGRISDPYDPAKHDGMPFYFSASRYYEPFFYGHRPINNQSIFGYKLLHYVLAQWKTQGIDLHKEIEEFPKNEADKISHYKKLAVENVGVDIDFENNFNIVDSALHSIAETGLAGTPYPVVTLATKDNNALKLWYQQQALEIFSQYSKDQFKIEAGRLTLRNQYEKAMQADLDAALSQEVPLADHIAAYKRLHGTLAPINASYEDEFDRIAAACDDGCLPDDLETMKPVLTERLEAAATGHQKSLKGALSQQAIDNWAACVDIDAALAEIAKRCAVASIEIARAEDVDEAEAAFNEGVKQVKAVRSTNTPHWTVSHSGGTRVAFNESNPASPKRYTDTEVTVTARHPDGKTIPGNCVIREIPKAVDEATGKPVPSTTSFTKNADGSFTAKVQLSGRPSGAKTLITVNGMNICGPSRIRIELVQPLVSP